MLTAAMARNLRGLLSAFFAFRILPTTILLFIIYATVFVGVIVTDPVQHIPKDTQGLDLEQAYIDLLEVRGPSLIYTAFNAKFEPSIDRLPHIPIR